jgi:2-oxoisovalerate dehydrogenase E1 component
MSRLRSVPEPSPDLPVTREEALALHRALVLPRLIEEKMLNLLRQGRLSKWFSGIGQEAIAVGVTSALRTDDWILPMHRNLGVFTGRAMDLTRLFRQLLGRDGGFTKGRDRTFHFGDLEHRVVGMISHLGANLPVADGLALAARLRGEDRVAAAFTGDGATSEGDFHEALNLAAVWKLPVLFVVENNQYGLSTPAVEQYACANLADRAAGYGMAGEIVDGNDLLAVRDATLRAAARARAGEGPTLLEFRTFRMRGHEEASGTAYVPRHLFEEWAKKDPILRYETLLLERGVLDEPTRDEVRREWKRMIDLLVDEAYATPHPTTTRADELADVLAPSLLVPAPPPPDTEAPEIRYIDAIRDAMAAAMRRDRRIVLLGQDIAEYGGVFKATQGLVEEFGKERVRNTPIIESGAVGCAMGLALDGFVPMLEMQFGDFVTCGFNQIVNHVAKTHWRWGARVPMVIRLPIGGGTGAGPFHSQNPEAWFTHVAGLKVVCPSNAHDAKGLLLAAFEDGNPVLYLEHKFLYRWSKAHVPKGHFTLPLGEASVARSGADATIVTWSVGVAWALEAAASLEEDGWSVEVVDLRSLIPWDRETVFRSVRKTSKVLVLHEAPITGGFGAEIAATVGRECFQDLDAPVERLGALDTPVPFSRGLEETFSPKGLLLPTLRNLLET